MAVGGVTSVTAISAIYAHICITASSTRLGHQLARDPSSTSPYVMSALTFPRTANGIFASKALRPRFGCYAEATTWLVLNSWRWCYLEVSWRGIKRTTGMDPWVTTWNLVVESRSWQMVNHSGPQPTLPEDSLVIKKYYLKKRRLLNGRQTRDQHPREQLNSKSKQLLTSSPHTDVKPNTWNSERSSLGL